MPLLSMLNHVALVILDSVAEPATEELVGVSLPRLRVVRGSLTARHSEHSLASASGMRKQRAGCVRLCLFVPAYVRVRLPEGPMQPLYYAAPLFCCCGVCRR